MGFSSGLNGKKSLLIYNTVLYGIYYYVCISSRIGVQNSFF